MDNQYILTPYFMGQHAGGLDELSEAGWVVNRRADEPPGDAELSPREQLAQIGALLSPLREAVTGAARAGRRPVSVAGDCIAAIGVLAGLQEAGIRPTVLWLDAHGDFNTWETTPSGFLGGMPLAMIVGRGEQALLKSAGLEPVPESRVILAGARDLDPGEQEALISSEVTHVERVSDLLTGELPDGPLYVHFDCDVLDAAAAPAMYYPTPNGPDAATLRRVFERLAETGRVVAASMSTWAPELDEDGRSRAVCMELLAELVDTAG
jgi:arginase